LRLFSFGGYGSALAALALVVFGSYDSYPAGQQLSKAEIPNLSISLGTRLGEGNVTLFHRSSVTVLSLATEEVRAATFEMCSVESS